jgi:hypothetical protein
LHTKSVEPDVYEPSGTPPSGRLFVSLLTDNLEQRTDHRTDTSSPRMISPPLQFGIIIPQERDDAQKSIKKTGELKEAGNGGMLFQVGKGRIRYRHAEGG